MYTQVASKLSVPESTTLYSQAVPMNGGNAIAIELTVFAGGTLNVGYEVSNDLENWGDGDTSLITAAPVGYKYEAVATTVRIAAQYVRLVYGSVASGPCVVAAGVHTMSY